MSRFMVEFNRNGFNRSRAFTLVLGLSLRRAAPSFVRWTGAFFSLVSMLITSVPSHEGLVVSSIFKAALIFE